MSVYTLLVEDNPSIRDNLIETLEELTDVKVVKVFDNEIEAKRWVADTDIRWNLAIIDILLKQGSGLGVLQLLQNRRPGTKAVALSNYATRDIRERCLKLGADKAFDKSSDLEALIDYCRSLSDCPGLH